MQKKIIFMVLLASLGLGFLGGWWGSQWRLMPSESVMVPPISSPLIRAQQAVAPAVVSIVEFEDEVRLGGGTGFLVNASGLVITNRHVVGNPDHQYVATLWDSTRYGVEVKARDTVHDLAFAQLVPLEEGGYAATRLGQLPFAQLGDSAFLQVGEPVLAIGNALSEYANTTTAGIISATGRRVSALDAKGRVSDLSGLLQTDAAINFGNSGGPLVSFEGKVIGVNTALDNEAQGIGFAVPIDVVKPALLSYQKYGEIRRPLLGVRYVMLTEGQARELELEVSHGALLTADEALGEVAIVAGSAADRAGLLANDVLMKVDGLPLTLDHTLQDAILSKEVGDFILLTVWRRGTVFEVNVELTDLI